MSSFSLVLKREKKFLIFIFLLSFILRSVFFCFLVKDKKYLVCKDSVEYSSVATQIAHGNGISNMQGDPTFFRVPGYSIFLALFYKLFNFDDVKTLWVQVFLSSFVPIVVFFLSLTLFSGNFLLAKIASIFVSISVGSILNSALLMSDSLFVLFFLIFIALFFSNFQMFFSMEVPNFYWKRFFASGIFLGILSLLRPVGHYVIVVSILLLFLSNFVFWQKIKSSICLFAGWFCIVFFLLLRNWILTGTILFHCMPGVHFLTYLACEVDSCANSCTYFESKNKLFKKFDAMVLESEIKKCGKINEIEKSDLASYLAKETIQHYPIITIKHSFINLFKTCFSLHSSYILFLFSEVWPEYTGTTSLYEKIKHYFVLDTKNKGFKLLIYYELICLLLLVLGFVGFVILAFFRKELWNVLIKCLPMIALFILLTFGSGVARLRLPIEPILMVLASYFMLTIFNKKSLDGFFS